MNSNNTNVQSILVFGSIEDLLNTTNSEYISISINNHINLRLTKENATNHPLGMVNIPANQINTISYDLSADQFVQRCYLFSNIKYLKMYYNKEDGVYQLAEVEINEESSLINFYKMNSHKFINVIDNALNKANIDDEITAYKFIISGIDMDNLYNIIIDKSSHNNSIIYFDSLTSEAERGKESYFTFTNINFKSKDSIRVGHEMEDFNDTSAYLKRLYQQTTSGCGLLVQLKIQFLIFINTLNAHACESMHNIIKLFIKAKDDGLVLKVLENQSSMSSEDKTLNSFYLLLVTMWEFMTWEMKSFFCDFQLWKQVIDKLDQDLINFKVTDDDTIIKYYNYMSEKIQRQLKSLVRGEDSGFLSNQKDLFYNFEPIDIEQEEVVSDNEMDPLYQDNNEQEYVEIYGSSEDEYAPAVASNITYKRC